MTAQQKIGSLLETAVPAFSVEEARAVAQNIFELDAVVSELSGERDRNFHLRVNEAEHYVLKVSNAAEDPQVTDFQTKALLHVASVDASLPVPRVIRTCGGKTEWVLNRPGEESRIVRVLTFLQGNPLHRATSSVALRRSIGSHLARLDLALRDFSHPAANHELMWDLKHASRIRDLLVHIPDAAQRGLAEGFLDNFEAHVVPVLPRLRTQVIHNDLNPYNVLVSGDDPDRVAGIIDFGDMVQTPVINNLAIAAAYQPTSLDHPLAGVADLVAAYNALLPLEPGEIDILFDLIATRMVLTVGITGWRAARYPENRDYILRNNPQAWAGLQRFTLLSRAEAQAYLHRACQGEN
ncbi:aminoglycoside phosphotransferase [Microvirga sp. KLBC 81]|uniref:phosphotransferase n=1 Tax=Microvirga sp. KLBC 81 TaxID=1862707 RepID=UPI000D50EBD4|nr:phosphotransferase [Microvirga sp. KLBC 81]PVE21268.1 aminoglycoside phosphotransferase [Microvirga sp. KLBC 81]